MTQPIRIQRKRAKGWKMPPNTVSVTRPSIWGNPFVVGKDGTGAECVHLLAILLGGYIALTAKATVEDQREYLTNARKYLPQLRGKNLACFCPLDRPCHADLLLELANRPVCEMAS